MWLLIGDLHLTDNVRDLYRFDIFDWIAKQQANEKPVATFLAGDITDAKDRHSATLVNNIVNGLLKLKPPVYIVMGNHDYRDPKNPFFKFLNHIEGIHFVVDPVVIKAHRPIALIPHYREQADFDRAVDTCLGARPAAFLVHQTFEGAIAESGVRLSGLSASHIESFKAPLGVYAGDVHKPQTQGQVTYIGCPYQVRFGDNFEPRCIEVAKSGTEAYPWFEAPRKWALTIRSAQDILKNSNLFEGDQVKLTIEVAREEAVDWKKIKQDALAACKQLKLEVYGVKLEVKTSTRHTRLLIENKSVNNTDTFKLFCKSENLASQIKAAGLEILKGKEV